VGDAVGQCERDLLKGDVDLQVLGGIVKGIDENYDVQKLRDSMRERVRRMREEQCGPRSRCRQP
jgi:hypothetical protein